MPAPIPIRTTGIIVGPIKPRLYDTTLPNGKHVMAHVPERRAAAYGELAPGTRVSLEMTHYDMDIARISAVG